MTSEQCSYHTLRYQKNLTHFRILAPPACMTHSPIKKRSEKLTLALKSSHKIRLSSYPNPFIPLTKMKLSFSLALLAPTLASAFTPAPASSSPAALAMSEAAAVPETPKVKAINGWVPDKKKFCYGLPGSISPLGEFDPLGFCKDRDLVGVKRFREAEVMHGRVAMMATVGYLITENTPTIAYGFEHPIIANDQIPGIPVTVLAPFFLLINVLEAFRATKGWVEPGDGELFTLRETYYPGDIGFDPLGWKPTGADFASMQAKELSNGRLAMFAVAGMCVQEIVTGQPLLTTVAGLL
jgi:hypothetical protein